MNRKLQMRIQRAPLVIAAAVIIAILLSGDVAAQPVHIEKSVQADTAYAGDTLIYSIEVTYPGATGQWIVQVFDNIPDLVIYLPGSANGAANYDAQHNLLNWLVSGSGPQDTVKLEFKGTIAFSVIDTIDIINRAYVPGGPGIVDTALTVALPISNYELNIAKEVDVDTAFAGDTLSYQIIVSNAGPDASGEIKIKDMIPAFTSFIDGSADAGGNFDISNNMVEWTLAGIAGGASSAVHFKVEIADNATPGVIVSNFAVMTSPDSVQSNEATTYIKANPVPVELGIIKNVDADSAFAGDTLHYTLTIYNSGQAAVVGIMVKDTIPQFTGYLEGSITNGGIYNDASNMIIWNIPALPPQQSVDLEFAAVIAIDAPEKSNITNIASIVISDTTLSDDAITYVKPAGTGAEDVVIFKQVNLDEASPGDTLLYTLTVSNTGTDIVNAITIKDTITALATYVAGSITGGDGNSVNANVLTWTINSLNSAAFMVLQFKTIIPDETADGVILYNQAFMTAPIVTPGNVVSTLVNAPFFPPDINLAKSANPTTITPGGTVTYSITAFNSGNGSLISGHIADLLPDGFTYISGSAKVDGIAVTADAGDSLIIPTGDIADGQTMLIEYRALAAADIAPNSSYINLAYLRGEDGLGAPQNFGPASAAVAVAVPQMRVTKTAMTPSAVVGGIVSFRIAVENISGADLFNIEVLDSMPQGMFYIEGSTRIAGAVGNDPAGENPYIWTIATLGNGATINIDFKVVMGTAVLPGLNRNFAWADIPALPGAESNRAEASLNILSTAVPGSIRGRIFVDCDDDGIPDVAAVPEKMDVFLDDGTHSQTNKQGMFYFSTVRPGSRVVALDERDLGNFLVASDEQSSVFTQVSEGGESYITFRLCPALPNLSMLKSVALVPRVKVTKTAKINHDMTSDSGGVVVDYEMIIKSNGGVDPTMVRVVDSFPQETRYIKQDTAGFEFNEDSTVLYYSVTVAQRRYHQMVWYSLEDLIPGTRRWLTNRIHLESTSPNIISQSEQPQFSSTTEVSVGPFLLTPPVPIDTVLPGAFFETAKAFLKPEAIPVLQLLADSMRYYDGAVLEADGYADIRPIHTKRFPNNRVLSEARAKSVIDWLKDPDNGNIDTTRMAYFGHGETTMFDPRNFEEGWWKNRRVQIKIHGRKESRLDLSAIGSEQWKASTLLELEPNKWDSLYINRGKPVEEGLDDVWEIRLSVENTGESTGENIIIRDILPAGCEYVSGSARFNNQPVSVEIHDGMLRINIGNLDQGFLGQLRYRIRAISESEPVGGGPAEAEITAAGGMKVESSSNNVTFK